MKMIVRKKILQDIWAGFAWVSDSSHHLWGKGVLFRARAYYLEGVTHINVWLNPCATKKWHFLIIAMTISTKTHTSHDVHNNTQHSRDLLRSHYSITTIIASPPLSPSPYIQQKDGDDILVCTDWKTYLYDICQHHTKQHFFVGHLISLLQICYNISSYRTI